MEHGILVWLLAAIVGLCVGSFLSVVVVRFPRMLMRGWFRDCQAFLQELSPADRMFVERQETYHLALPRSHCHHCGEVLRWKDNIPLLSFLYLKGRCRYCHTRLSWRYPLLELFSALASVGVFMHWGLTVQGGASLFLLWVLLALTWIDLEHQLLPDEGTLGLLWLGLCLNSFSLFVPLSEAVWGAVAGYATLAVLTRLFALLTGKEGMGAGDFKLFAALGAWLGLQALPAILIIASALGSVVGLLYLLWSKQGRNTRIPFGPFLAIAGIWVLCWGDPLKMVLGGWH